jgi:hypothetical protein
VPMSLAKRCEWLRSGMNGLDAEGVIMTKPGAAPSVLTRGGGGGQRARSSSRCVCAARVVPARANERNIGVLVHDPMDAGGEPTAQTGGAGGPGWPSSLFQLSANPFPFVSHDAGAAGARNRFHCEITAWA